MQITDKPILYEYKSVRLYSLRVDDLNQYGLKGWELVSSVPVNNDSDIIHFLKRKLVL